MRHLFVAGFDFGTSYSKVVVRDQLTNVAKIVTFGSISRSGLFPSYVRVSDRVLHGPEAASDGFVVSYPKLIATDAAAREPRFSSLYRDAISPVAGLVQMQSLENFARLILTRYFLSVLDEIHRFIGEDQDWYRFDPDVDPLVVQLAVPIGLNTADNACEKIMQQSLAAATLLRAEARKPSPTIRIQDVQSAFSQLAAISSRNREDLDARCITYPEVAAGVQTVLRSPNTPDGKYITMDVGAGTIDLNAFLRHPRDEKSIGAGLDYWACEVRPLGFARLKLAGSHPRQHHEVSVSCLDEKDVMDQLGAAVSELMSGAFRYQPNRIPGNGRAPWTHRTQAFMWGGGSEHEPYGEKLLHQLKLCGVKVSDINRLPAPSDQLSLPPDVKFGRLAVAYGLSFHKTNLESIRLPSELKKFDQLYPSYWNEVIAAEKLCSCRGNPVCPRCHGLGVIRPDSSLAPNFIVSSHTHVQVQEIRRSRFEISLERCVKAYLSLDPGQALLIDRFLLLERIARLCTRPENQNDTLIRQRADGILNHNVSLFKGVLLVQKYSAKPKPNGCQCLVRRKVKGSYADVLVLGSPNYLEEIVNDETSRNFVHFYCTIARTEKREFFLDFIRITN